MKMKDYIILKGNGIFNIELFIVLLIDLLIIFLINDSILNVVIITVVLTIAQIALIYNRFYYFMYNKDVLVVRHLWFGVKKTYLLEHISSIKLVNAPYNGRAVFLLFKSGRKRVFGASTIKIDKIQEMIVNINRVLNVE